MCISYNKQKTEIIVTKQFLLSDFKVSTMDKVVTCTMFRVERVEQFNF